MSHSSKDINIGGKLCLSVITQSYVLFSDGELNVLDDILTDAPDHDDELYNPDSEQDKSEKKGMLINQLGVPPESKKSQILQWSSGNR